MEALQKLATKLSGDSDQLKQAYAELEKRFAAMGLGVEAAVDLDLTELKHRGHDVTTKATERSTDVMGYGKVDGKWCIYFQVRSNTGPAWETKRICYSDASRKFRVAGVYGFKALTEALVATAQEMSADLARALDVADDFLKAQQ